MLARLLLLLSLFCQGLVFANSDVSIGEAEDAFLKFVQTYNKNYATEAERFQRFHVFMENMRIAKQLDAADPKATFGVTQFSDLTREEFRQKYLIKNFTAIREATRSFPVAKTVKVAQLPSEFDWNSKGVVTPVYNQGQCGSCWAFSVTENIESMWALAGHQLTSLSMQQIVDCDNSDYGCSGGDPPTAYQYVESCGGLDSASSYPYDGEDGQCEFNPNDVVARISGWQYVTQSENEQQMQSWTYQNGPPSICVDAETWQYYVNGVITGNCGQSLDHCVQITGWANVQGVNAWHVRNSWGTSWGMDGYLYVEMGQDICGIAQEVTSSII